MATKVTLNTSSPNRVSVSGQKKSTIRTVGISSLAERGRFANLDDVDATGAENNEIVVYNSTTGKYEVKTLPQIDGGSY
jgi:hypothetical protein